MASTSLSPTSQHRGKDAGFFLPSRPSPSATTSIPQRPSPKLGTPRQTRPDLRPSSSSYFGLVVDTNNAPSSSTHLAKVPREPPGSAIRSTAAATPQPLPLDVNPEYDAFRKEAEQSTFSLGQSDFTHFSLNPSTRQTSRPLASRTHSKKESIPSKPRPGAAFLKKAETISDVEIARSSRSPKRMLSNDSAAVYNRPRRGSPTSVSGDSSRLSGSPPSRHDEREKHPRLSLSHSPAAVPSGLQHYRADTLPASLDISNPSLITPLHAADLLKSSADKVLLLDLRVLTQYARSRITGALNLCIPTTLLKRTSYDVQRLSETFKQDTKKHKFDSWRACKCILVYDTNSSQLKEASNCLNIIKKFTSEGWNGMSCIIRGGFAEFAKKCPSLIDDGPDSSQPISTPSLTISPEKAIPPVIGGCPMPATKSAANPFFGNIRQNMDLIGGVGQMPVQHPPDMTKQSQYDLPAWLRKASDAGNNGKDVSQKFLRIEECEQKRMQEALSGNVVYGSPGPGAAKKVQIAGIEKGSKNRYNNIWPYEHSRVKLQGVSPTGCDYVNASFVKTSLSSKKYIATQGPIPATFTDFWNMVWQHDVRVIVMLTAETEGGQIKAHNYWKGTHYGPLKLHFLSEHHASLEPLKLRRHRQRPDAGRRKSSTFSSSSSISGGNQPEKHPSSPTSSEPYVIVRKFTLAHENYPFERIREITQLQYSSWPDFGAPAHPAHLLGLVEQCDAVVRSGRSPTGPEPSLERPVLVHCSAGCGRTGTFCTVDSVVDMLKRQRISRTRAGRQVTSTDMDTGYSEARTSSGRSHDDAGGDWLAKDDLDLVEKTVEEFRLQRLSMVQSLRQFVLCYETVLEWIVEQGQPKTA